MRAPVKLKVAKEFLQESSSLFLPSRQILLISKKTLHSEDRVESRKKREKATKATEPEEEELELSHKGGEDGGMEGWRGGV